MRTAMYISKFKKKERKGVCKCTSRLQSDFSKIRRSQELLKRLPRHYKYPQKVYA